ncbi:hypothetical protein NP233_g7669 [Leucocoprinus birnbaumii]|uniref:Uncharacterized protein n=1 Tax=Leucocoprinus birnbaumii TaxID=56174 RepID=A0AAD5VP03_9AGAR|nr:hypothetical protein NP233_g7669 [Leucocoprinus birnbaumii]
MYATNPALRPIEVDLSPADVERQPFLPALGAHHLTPTQPLESYSYTPVLTLTRAILNLLLSTTLCTRLLTSRSTTASYSWRMVPSLGGSTYTSDVEGESSRPSSASPREKKKAEKDLPFIANVITRHRCYSLATRADPDALLADGPAKKPLRKLLARLVEMKGPRNIASLPVVGVTRRD